MGPVLYPKIEQELLEVELIHPRGNECIRDHNDEKWIAALKRFLVDLATMQAINGDRYRCSVGCLDEEHLTQGKKYQFKDTARFALANC